MEKFDFLAPNYSLILAERQRRLLLLRTDPKLLAASKKHYKENPADFINDWGMTFDPRNIEKDLPALVPFVLFPRQVETIEWFHTMWKGGNRGLVEKTRDFGLSWLSIAYGCTMWFDLAILKAYSRKAANSCALFLTYSYLMAIAKSNTLTS